MHAAALGGDVATAAVVLANAGDLLEVRDPDGRSPLATAVAHGANAVARCLVHLGAAVRYGVVDTIDEAEARGDAALAAFLRGVDVLRGGGPLPVLCFAGDLPPAYVQRLVASGADVDVFAAARRLPRVVLDAAEPWSPANHRLFPLAARRRVAVALTVALRLEARGVPRSVFLADVLPLAMDRGPPDAAADRATLLACYAGRSLVESPF